MKDHHFRAGASGQVEGCDDKYYYGPRRAGFYILRFRRVGDDHAVEELKKGSL